MKTIAIPVEEDCGLESRVSSSFGNGKYYLIVELDGGQVRARESVEAPESDCSKWSCRPTSS